MRHGGLIFLAILVTLISYTGFKFHQILKIRGRTALVFSLLLFGFMIGWQFIYRSYDPLGSRLFMFWVWGGSAFLGLWATFFLFSIPYDLIVNSYLRIKKSPDLKRREVFTRLIPGALLGFSGTLTGAGFSQALAGPVVKNIDIEIQDLPEGLRGMKIAQISDLHVSPLIQRDYVEKVVRQVLDINADLIAVTGDLADGTPEELAEALQPLERLKARLGTYYITGNHEYYWNAKRWIEKGKDLGFVPLLNEGKLIEHKGSKFLLGGVTDSSSEQFEDFQKSDPFKALGDHKDVPFKLLLAHRPESCVEAEKAGWTLQLSGHTHGGQFFPFMFLVHLAHKYYRGLNRYKDLQVYVNSGTGYWGPPHRLWVPAEVTSIRLTHRETQVV